MAKNKYLETAERVLNCQSCAVLCPECSEESRQLAALVRELHALVTVSVKVAAESYATTTDKRSLLADFALAVVSKLEEST